MTRVQELVNKLNDKGLNDIGLAIILMEKGLTDLEQGNYSDEVNISESKPLMLQEMKELIDNAKKSSLIGADSSDPIHTSLRIYYEKFANRIEKLTEKREG
ncbi:hypothetical protein ACTWKC_17745 [Bacillus sp. 4A_MP3]|uniref:hypothetical protein n=1 Tax=Bacillus velezensis TaxID=492670 RepID=UPI002ADE3213|nr:hypothetical protein [Bacillus velezensis]MEA1004883.1 hypothetical protein [Bacillus velezensis]